MKRWILALSVLGVLAAPQLILGDGYIEPPATPTTQPAKKSYRGKKHRANPIAESEPLIPPPPTCSSRSPSPKVQIVSWVPRQKVSKVLGSIQECVTNQWDILKLLGGPNVIGLAYPEEKEMWAYSWLWSYKLANPVEETAILMDNPGKRIVKGKNPVELSIVFNDEDVVEKVEMVLVKRRKL